MSKGSSFAIYSLSVFCRGQVGLASRGGRHYDYTAVVCGWQIGWQVNGGGGRSNLNHNHNWKRVWQKIEKLEKTLDLPGLCLEIHGSHKGFLQSIRSNLADVALKFMVNWEEKVVFFHKFSFAFFFQGFALFCLVFVDVLPSPTTTADAGKNMRSRACVHSHFSYDNSILFWIVSFRFVSGCFLLFFSWSYACTTNGSFIFIIITTFIRRQAK